jgi:hypothetical protein
MGALRARTAALIAEGAVANRDEQRAPEADEIAETVRGTLRLPDIALLRPHLIPEWPIYSLLADTAAPTALAGRIDAVVFQNGKPSIVLDWKSDIAPTEEDIQLHMSQLAAYLRVTGATRGALVYMTSGMVRWTAALAPDSSS